ncbi:DUF551 domain-containing protein [Salmonella enterica subsp. salamae]|uniref:DUF551 domain-containing protein n=3 Tax=Enterobacteriaceae TaxID=543 RepID=A0A8F7U9K3_SALER|nr:DUF551 domain-containing protein [Salmonella enterica]EAA4082886.1 DUF551 domain-containing protein [Salmonella enterica subsp. salamae serovar Sofia]EEO2936777.1 DUF551 domain-containing protein [Salmonella enterica subsp. salamae]EBS4542138.1 DUF551 domain-containing protein [Salmonella enterica subsp. salamae serovar Sofia]ECD9384248.1 DUF551 domain-containing protein [Salmonella enterica subsp. salamae serovar Sofia]QXX11644.1 DUF551 domain-containing protein [Salmonella enterica]
MTTITREQLHERARRKVKELEFAITQSAFTSIRDGLNEELELARIALASLDAKPIYQYQSGIYNDDNGETDWYWDDCDAGFYKQYAADRRRIVYTAQPAPAVPDYASFEEFWSSFEHQFAEDDELKSFAVEIWNACRAAMLQAGNHTEQHLDMVDHSGDANEKGSDGTFIDEGTKQAGNSPVIPDGWISCSERMPNDKQYVWCWGKSYGWTEYDTFEGYYDWSRNKWWTVTDDGEEPASKVTHWMPLPEPPQEVKQ